MPRYEFARPSSVFRRPLLIALFAAGLLLAACGDDDDDDDAPPEETPAVTTPTGIAEVDRVIEVVLAGDTAGLIGLSRLTEADCVDPNTDGIPADPLCEDGEEPGTTVSAFPAAACEGYWVRDPSPLLTNFVGQVTGLYAVVKGRPVDGPFPLGGFIVIFSADTAVGREGYTATVQDGAVVSVQTGCRPPEDFMTFQGEPLEIVLAPQAGGPDDAGEQLARATNAARNDLVARLGLSLDDTSLKRAEPVIWATSCLGIVRPEMACAAISTPGWVLWVQGGEELHRYHSDRPGEDVRHADGPITLGVVAIPQLPLPDEAQLDADGDGQGETPRRTGDPGLDRVIEAVERRDLATLVQLSALQSVECIETQDGIGGPPLCEDGESAGTVVSVFPAAYCEGTLVRDQGQVLEQFASMARGLYAVTRGPGEPREAPYWPVGDTFLVFHTEADFGRFGGRLVIEDGAIVMTWFGCGSAPADVAAWRGEPLPLIAGPFPEPLPTVTSASSMGREESAR